MLKVFSDYHHDQLYKSLQHLFEKRLGFELYRPIGEDWFDLGYWDIAAPYGNNRATITQYLKLDQERLPEEYKLNKNAIDNQAYYQVGNQKALTFDQFRETDIDIIIASIPAHVETYRRLIKTHKPQAKLIYQIGNDWPLEGVNCQNILASIKPMNYVGSRNIVFYHQEFDLELFNFEENQKEKKITSFVHCLSGGSHFKKDWIDFLEIEKRLPEYEFKAYGALCRDGSINEQKKVAEIIKNSKWGINLKTGGDGFGHTLYNFAACGIPVIFRQSQYNNKLGEEMLIHTKTGLDLDRIGYDEIVQQITSMTEEEYLEISKQTYRNFCEKVSFQNETDKIKKFIENLK